MRCYDLQFLLKDFLIVGIFKLHISLIFFTSKSWIYSMCFTSSSKLNQNLSLSPILGSLGIKHHIQEPWGRLLAIVTNQIIVVNHY
jgi:hypothetical protein